MSIIDSSTIETLRQEYNRLLQLNRELMENLINLNPDSAEANVLRDRIDELDDEIRDLRNLLRESSYPIMEEEDDEIDDVAASEIEQQGNGFFIRDPTIDPPAVRKILESIGNEKVQTLKLIRTPLSKTTKFLLNLASLGRLQRATEQIGVDDFFHLAMIINNKYMLEKNEVIRLYRDNRIPEGSITLDVPVQIDITIKEMLDATKQQMGNLYGAYDAKTNNCGIFLDNVLKSNGMSNNETDKFLNQPTIELFNQFPKFSEILTKLGTTLGAVGSRVIEGEGVKRESSKSTPIDKTLLETYEEQLSDVLEQIENNDEEVQTIENLIFSGSINNVSEINRTINRLSELRNNQITLYALRDDFENKIADLQQRGAGVGKLYIFNFGLHYAKMTF